MDSTPDGIMMSDLPVNKIFCDKHAILFDSGDQFSAITRIVIDQDDTPDLRLRIGVVEWIRNKTIITYQFKYASPGHGDWKVYHSMPKQWSSLIERLLVSASPAAFGGHQPNKWFIHYEMGPAEDPNSTYIWLGHINEDYAKRKMGPAKSSGD
jgi:hypothetical protein